MDSLDLHYRKGTKQNFFFFFFGNLDSSQCFQSIFEILHMLENWQEENLQILSGLFLVSKSTLFPQRLASDRHHRSHYTANYLNHRLKKLKISYPRSLFATRCVKKAYTSQMTITLNFCCHLKIKQKTLPLPKIKNKQASKQKQQQNRKQEMFASRCLC